jgi:chromosome segregation ATPase
MEQVMKLLSSIAAVVTATSIGIATERAWSADATPGGTAVPAVQTPAPATSPAPGRFPPYPHQGGYAQRWQQPSQWYAPPAAYGQVRPYYPQQRQYRAVPATPAKIPVRAESKQTQEPLTTKSAEVDTAHATLERLQFKLQQSSEAERALNEKVAAITGEQQALQARVTELMTKLDTSNATLEQQRQQITNEQEQYRTLTAGHERLRSDLASRDEQLATVQADLLAATQTLQQAQSGNTLSSEQLGTAMAQADTLRNVLTELKARLESQQSTLQNAGLQTAPQAVQQAPQQAQPMTTTSGQQPGAAGAQVAVLNNALNEVKMQLKNQNIRLQDTTKALADVVAERDGLQAELADCRRN